MKSLHPAYSVSSSAYDQRLGQLLNPDIFACGAKSDMQDPTNAQSYNRYAYCLNNSLKYMDSTGCSKGWDIDECGTRTLPMFTFPSH